MDVIMLCRLSGHMHAMYVLAMHLAVRSRAPLDLRMDMTDMHWGKHLQTDFITIYILLSCSFDGGVAQAIARQFPGHTNWAVKFHPGHWSNALSDHKKSLVYLTADAEEEIQTLDTNCYYIIGGLVDRNQHKRICLNRAEEHGIRTARLPLANFLQLAGSKVR